MAMLYRLMTKGGDIYYIKEDARGKGMCWTLQSAGSKLPVEFPSLARLFFTLGGMVEWMAWTDDAQFTLKHLNGGKAI